MEEATSWYSTHWGDHVPRVQVPFSGYAGYPAPARSIFKTGESEDRCLGLAATENQSVEGLSIIIILPRNSVEGKRIE